MWPLISYKLKFNECKEAQTTTPDHNIIIRKPITEDNCKYLLYPKIKNVT